MSGTQCGTQSQDLQLSFIKYLVQSFATTMDTMQKINQAFMLEIAKAFTGNGPSQKKQDIGSKRLLSY